MWIVLGTGRRGRKNLPTVCKYQKGHGVKPLVRETKSVQKKSVRTLDGTNKRGSSYKTLGTNTGPRHQSGGGNKMHRDNTLRGCPKRWTFLFSGTEKSKRNENSPMGRQRLEGGWGKPGNLEKQRSRAGGRNGQGEILN